MRTARPSADRGRPGHLAGVLPAVVVLVLGIVLTTLATSAAHERRRVQVRDDLGHRVEATARTLEQRLRSHAASAAALGEWAAASQPIDSAAFHRLAARLVDLHDGVRTLELAPAGIVRLVHPRVGNEGALGVDLERVATSAGAMRALRGGADHALDGPVELPRGGRAAVVRARVDRPAGEAAGEARGAWGVASAVVSLDTLLDEAGLLRPGIDWSLAVATATDESAPGTARVAGRDLGAAGPVVAEVVLPGAVWQLAMAPHGGWAAVQGVDGALSVAGVAVSLALALLALVLRRQPARLRHQVASATAAVGASHLRTRAVMDAAGDAIVAIDHRGDIVDWNSATLRLLRIDAADVAGRAVRAFVDLTTIPVTEQHDGQQLGRAPLTVVRADGSAFPAEVSVAWTPTASMRTVVIRDVTVQQRQNDDLRRHVLELERLNSEQVAIDALKRDFMQMANHEVRTPLTAIRGFALTLNRHWEQMAEEDRRRSLDAIHRQATRLWQLLDNMLTTSRLEGGALEQRVATIDVHEVIAVAVAESQVARDHVVVQAEPSLTTCVDADHLTRVLVALLSNAAKYGVPPIHVQAALDGSDLVIRVTDHGPGVPFGFRSRLFEPFSQASTGMRREAVGSGLGLAVARGLARANGGDVWHEDHPGVGATFALRLPRRSARDLGSGRVHPGAANEDLPTLPQAARNGPG